MSDKELIEFLWRLLWEDLSDGEIPSSDEQDVLLKELTDRGILNGEFPA